MQGHVHVHTQTLGLSPVWCSWLGESPSSSAPSTGVRARTALACRPQGHCPGGPSTHLLIVSPTQLQQSLLVFARGVILEGGKRGGLPLTQPWDPQTRRDGSGEPQRGEAKHLFTEALTLLLSGSGRGTKQRCTHKYLTTALWGGKSKKVLMCSICQFLGINISNRQFQAPI